MPDIFSELSSAFHAAGKGLARQTQDQSAAFFDALESVRFEYGSSAENLSIAEMRGAFEAGWREGLKDEQLANA